MLSLEAAAKRYSHKQDTAVEFIDFSRPGTTRSDFIVGTVSTGRRWGRFGPKESVRQIARNVRAKIAEISPASDQKKRAEFMKQAAGQLRSLAWKERKRTFNFDINTSGGLFALLILGAFVFKNADIYYTGGLVNSGLFVGHETMKFVRYSRLTRAGRKLSREADRILNPKKKRKIIKF